LRLLRVLKLVKRFNQLGVIVNALLNGMSSIGYLALVLILFFYVYSIIGMLLFAQDDPWHFTYLHDAFMTLFKCVTLDGWSSNAYILMYGCNTFPGAAYEQFPGACPSDAKAFGIIAVAFFLVLILIGTQVLLSLFIGVISTSLDDSRAADQTERDLDRRLAATSKKMLLSPERIEAFKKVFRLLDLDQGGTIDFDELQQGMESINSPMKDADIMQILVRVDPEGIGLDVNGFINFMAETPLFLKGTRTAMLLAAFTTFGGGQAGVKKSWKKKRGTWFYALSHPLEQLYESVITPIDDFFQGGRAAREHMDQMYNALLIQDAWKEIGRAHV
jgi:Ca2+-binding EF-hand superfamily protein